MKAPHSFARTALTALALAAALFAAGTGRALAPEQGACVATQQLRVEQDLPPQESAPADPGQRVLARYFARRYQVASGATQRWVRAAYRAGEEVGLDPLLVLAVISVESRFNPVAESVMGAQGLMQIIPRFHRDELLEAGGEDAVLDPETNILVGARILQEYVSRSGTLEGGLQTYNGALSDPAGLYAQKVLAERDRLQRVLRVAPAGGRAMDGEPTTGS